MPAPARRDAVSVADPGRKEPMNEKDDRRRKTSLQAGPPAGSPRAELPSEAAVHGAALIRRITGERSILVSLRLLQGLAERCGQAGELDQLAYYLSAARVRAKRPHLLLFKAAFGEVYAAVFVLEYRAGPVPTRFFFSLDFTGQRTVIAPARLRTAVAAEAAAYLLRQGALLALMSVEGQSFRGFLELQSGFRTAVLDRPIRQLWRLGQSLEDTLAGMGKHTRRNFRLYLRTLETTGGAFVPEARPAEADFLRLNRECAYHGSHCALALPGCGQLRRDSACRHPFR